MLKRLSQSIVHRVIRYIVHRVIRYTVAHHPKFAGDILFDLSQNLLGTPTSPDHYYNPFPNLHRLAASKDRWNTPGWFDQRSDAAKQVDFLRQLTPYREELKEPPTADQIAKH